MVRSYPSGMNSVCFNITLCLSNVAPRTVCVCVCVFVETTPKLNQEETIWNIVFPVLLTSRRKTNA